MLPNCFTCSHKIIQYNKHLFNNQNQEIEAFSGTKNLLDLEASRGIEGILFVCKFFVRSFGSKKGILNFLKNVFLGSFLGQCTPKL